MRLVVKGARKTDRVRHGKGTVPATESGHRVRVTARGRLGKATGPMVPVRMARPVRETAVPEIVRGKVNGVHSHPAVRNPMAK